MKELSFTVEGSRGDLYSVTFVRSGNNLNCFCSCQAGQNGLYCKHRFALMEGDVTDLVSENEDDVGLLKQMLVGTDVEAAYAIVRDAEISYEKAKQTLSDAKHRLAVAMRK